MFENMYKIFLINDEVMPMIPYLSAINLSAALAGIFVFLKRTQIILWAFVFFGSLWANSELPYATQASIIAAIGWRTLILIIIYLIGLKLMKKPIPLLLHPDWTDD